MKNYLFTTDFIQSPFDNQKNFQDSKPAPVFIKEFNIDDDLQRATMLVATLGNGYIEINNQAIKEKLITPQSNYLKTIFYNEIDVTKYLKKGKMLYFLNWVMVSIMILLKMVGTYIKLYGVTT